MSSRIHRRVREAIAKGHSQLVVIAGGLDTLALRVAEDLPRLRVFEVDHPATQAAKRSGLARAAPLPPNLHFAAADLATFSIDAVLVEAGLDPSIPTVFVLEGFLMYLREPDVSDLLEALARVMRGGTKASGASTCVFTAMEVRPDGAIGFRGGRAPLVDLWLRRQNERFLWGRSPALIRQVLACAGWSLLETSTTEDLAAASEMTCSDLAVGESVGVAVSSSPPRQL